MVPNIELKDAGTYICKAKNPVGTASYSIHVRVVRCKFAELRGNSIQRSPEGEVNSGAIYTPTRKASRYISSAILLP